MLERSNCNAEPLPEASEWRVQVVRTQQLCEQHHRLNLLRQRSTRPDCSLLGSSERHVIKTFCLCVFVAVAARCFAQLLLPPVPSSYPWDRFRSCTTESKDSVTIQTASQAKQSNARENTTPFRLRILFNNFSICPLIFVRVFFDEHSGSSPFDGFPPVCFGLLGAAENLTSSLLPLNA